MEAEEQTRLRDIIEANGKKARSKMTTYKEALSYLEEFPSSRSWLNNIKSNLTTKIYARKLFYYCAETGYNPSELVLLKPTTTELTAKIFYEISRGKKTEEITTNEKLAEQTLEDFLGKTKFKDKLGIKNALVSFCKHNDRPLNPSVASGVEQREKPFEDYNLPTVEDVDSMSKATTYYRDEFLIWFLASTGCRRGTLPQLTFGDLCRVFDVDGKKKIVPYFAPVENGQLDDLTPIFLRISSEKLKGKGKGKYKGNVQLTFLHFKAYQKLNQYVKWLRNKKIPITPKTPLFAKSRKPFDTIGDTIMREIVVKASINAFGNGKVLHATRH